MPGSHNVNLHLVAEIVRVLSVNVEQHPTKLDKQKPGGGLISLGWVVGVCSLSQSEMGS